jgi:hypothetical protein
MQASDYLKMKFQSDRQLAVYSQQGVTSAWKAMKGIGSDIYSGVERAGWYSSCLIPGYHDVCQELISEEKRMYLSVRSIFHYHDVMAHILNLYFEMLINDSKDGNKSGKIRKADVKVAKMAVNIPAGKATRLALALALSKALSESGFLSKVVIEQLSRRTPTAVLAFQLFGTDQKCALAARRLKSLDPKYFAILYNAEVEMLYYFVEPLLSDIIKKYHAAFYKNFDELFDDIKREFNV